MEAVDPERIGAPPGGRVRAELALAGAGGMMAMAAVGRHGGLIGRSGAGRQSASAGCAPVRLFVDSPGPARHNTPPRNAAAAGRFPVVRQWRSGACFLGGVSRVAKGADCKSAGERLRRFESYLSHQPSRFAATARQASQPIGAKRAKAVAPKFRRNAGGRTTRYEICLCP